MKISIHEANPCSAVSFYRSIGPFSYLKKIDKNIETELLKRVDWSTLIGTDIFYIERPQVQNDLTALEMAKDFNVKTWVDYDDLLHCIPQENPGYKFYNDDQTKKTIEESLKIADVVTVSTPAIKEYYKPLNNNIIVLPNAFNDYNYKFEHRKQSDYTDNPLITWRGSATHRKDLLSIKEQLLNIDKKYKSKLSFCFIGNETWFITDHILNRKFQVKECDIIDFMIMLKEIRGSIHLSPLEVSEFNKAKSNIGYLEGTYMGSVTIAPSELPEFNVPGCVLYSSEKNNFEYILEKCIKSKSFRQENYDKAFEYVKNNRLLSQINKQRLKIIEEAL
jgi:hypothetical protein